MISWVEALGARVGPLKGAAYSFARDRGGEALGRNRQGIAELASAVSHWTGNQEADEDADRHFVEGAGAWLGLILIDAMAGEHASGRGVHRVRLGKHGFFDPFGAIEAVLEAPSPRAELAQHVRRAEAEANGTGPLARVVSTFEDILERTTSYRIAKHFEFDVELDAGIEVDLRRVVRATSDQAPSAVVAAVSKLTDLLRGQNTSVSWGDARPCLLPRLVASDFGHNLGTGNAAPVHTEPLSDDVAVAYILPQGTRARFIRSDELSAWGVDLERARRQAVGNLAQRSAAARFVELQTPQGSLVVARSGDALDAARILLPSLHAVLAPHLGEDIVVAVPHRDALYAASATDRGVVDAMTQYVHDQFARAPHAITKRLFYCGPTGVTFKL